MPLPYRPISCSVEGRSLKVKPWKPGTVPLFSHAHKWTYRWLSWHVHYSFSSSLGLQSIMDIDACTDRSSFEGLFAAKEAQVQRHNGGSTTITINLSSQSSASSPSSLHRRSSQHLDFRKPVHLPSLTKCKGSSPCFQPCEFWSSFGSWVISQ